MSARPARIVVAEVAPRAVSIPMAAELLGVSESMVRRLLADGDFPHVRFGERVVVPLAALDSWLAAKSGIVPDRGQVA